MYRHVLTRRRLKIAVLQLAVARLIGRPFDRHARGGSRRVGHDRRPGRDDRPLRIRLQQRLERHPAAQLKHLGERIVVVQGSTDRLHRDAGSLRIHQRVARSIHRHDRELVSLAGHQIGDRQAVILRLRPAGHEEAVARRAHRSVEDPAVGILVRDPRDHRPGIRPVGDGRPLDEHRCGDVLLLRSQCLEPVRTQLFLLNIARSVHRHQHKVVSRARCQIRQRHPLAPPREGEIRLLEPQLIARESIPDGTGRVLTGLPFDTGIVRIRIYFLLGDIRRRRIRHCQRLELVSRLLHPILAGGQVLRYDRILIVRTRTQTEQRDAVFDHRGRISYAHLRR